jgi:hypothetical protein
MRDLRPGCISAPGAWMARGPKTTSNCLSRGMSSSCAFTVLATSATTPKILLLKYIFLFFGPMNQGQAFDRPHPLYIGMPRGPFHSSSPQETETVYMTRTKPLCCIGLTSSLAKTKMKHVGVRATNIRQRKRQYWNTYALNFLQVVNEDANAIAFICTSIYALFEREEPPSQCHPFRLGWRAKRIANTIGAVQNNVRTPQSHCVRQCREIKDET